MASESPSSARRILGTLVVVAIGVAAFVLLARLAGASPVAVTIGAVVIVAVGVVTALITPRRRRARALRQAELEQRRQ